MFEHTANFHQHTTYSDGSGLHSEVIAAGKKADLNVMVFTDHNIWVDDIEGWYDNTLVIMGIEVNDPTLKPEQNHYLCLGVDRDLNEYAGQPQQLIDAVNRLGGVGFIAHPFERPSIPFNEPAIPWNRWEVSGYQGLEIWNYMSEFKAHLTGKTTGLAAALDPARFISGPFPETLAHWDSLLETGQKVVAIGGSDAHANSYSLGPITRVIFPYDYLFSAVRTHLLLPNPLSSDFTEAKAQTLACLRDGHCFVAYDLIGDTYGFQFSAAYPEADALFGQTEADPFMQGDELALETYNVVNLRVQVPSRAEIRLLHNGRVVAKTRGLQLQHLTTEPGVYRVECYKVHKTRWRGWIYSNPIYIGPQTTAV